jgi:hypothetical protein
MRLHMAGKDVPAELTEVVALLTDHARLRYTEVTRDAKSQTVRLPITRYPLVKKRRVLPNVHDQKYPIAAVVTVRNVLSCEIENNTTPDFGEEVHLIFGGQIQGKQLYARSAEEDRGRPCYSVAPEVSELDLEVADVASVGRPATKVATLH